MFNNQHTLLSRVTSAGCQESLHIINKADGRPAITTKLSCIECCYVHLRASRFPTGLRIFLCFYVNTAGGITCTSCNSFRKSFFLYIFMQLLLLFNADSYAQLNVSRFVSTKTGKFFSRRVNHYTQQRIFSVFYSPDLL